MSFVVSGVRMNLHSLFLGSVFSHLEMPSYWALDTNQDLYQDWDRAGLHVLFLFLTDCDTKAFSTTYSCVSTLIKDTQPSNTDIFIDAAFYPSQSMQEVLASLGIPMMVGNVSHRTWDEYDIVAISHSISLEALNLIRMYRQSKFPFSYQERLKAKTPLVLYGGAAASTMFPALGGEIEGHGKSFYDVAMLGNGEPILPPLFTFLYQFHQEHPIKENKELLMDSLLNQSFSNRLLFPMMYDITHKDGRVQSITRKDPRVPDKVILNQIHTPMFKGFCRKLFTPYASASERHFVQISSGCSSYCCSFCMEGQEGGHYTEKPIEDIEKDILQSKKYSAANNYNAFSYNTNYYSQYYSMLKLFVTHSQSTSIFNQRVDVVANSPEYVFLSRKVGVIKMSMACEGLSDRLRQRILNKNLTRETLIRACRNVFRQKMIHLKFTMLVTGLETQEDIQEFYDTVDEMLAIRDSSNATTSILFTFTPLVYYIQTPLRWESRLISKAFWEGKKLLSEILKPLLNRGIKLKFNGTGLTPYVEQLVIDAGWQATNVLTDIVLNSDIDYTCGVDKVYKPLLERILAKYSIPYDFNFNGFDPDTSLLPNDMVAFTTSQKLEEWKEMSKQGDFYHPLCLKTQANPKPRCYNCGACETKGERDSVVNRTLNDRDTYISVLEAQTKSRPRMVVRVVVKQYPQFAFYSKEMLTHYITSQFLRRNDGIAQSYYKVSSSSLCWLSEASQPPYYSGLFSYYIYLKDFQPLNLFQSLVDSVNEVLETCQVVSVSESSLTEDFKKTDMSLFLCKLPFCDLTTIQTKLLNFNWMVRHPVRTFTTGAAWNRKDYLSYKDSIFFRASRDGVVSAMALPLTISPFWIISSLLRKRVEECYLEMPVQVVDTVRSLGASCSCGNSSFYSLLTDKVEYRCPQCYLKRILCSLPL